MPLSNTTQRFGFVTKTFHWLTVLLILTLIPLGIVANSMGFETSEALARKAFVFSLHKTLGVTVFFVALLRILWALTQTKPGLLNNEKPMESFLAELVHWTLYAALVLVPLTGWIHHASTTGFAPIWWPLGQNLPFVPKSEGVAETFAALHIIFERVLVVSILLHVAGALKHHFIDKDPTLRRMWFGDTDLPETAPHRKRRSPMIVAGLAYVAAIGIGAGMGLFAPHNAPAQAATLETVESQWQVQDGSIAIGVVQLGSNVSGTFSDWTAAINFDEAGREGLHGDVTVEIAISSLTLGSVTGQALGPDFFHAEAFPSAIFSANILAVDTGFVADGTLSIKGTEMPVSLPFDLAIDGDTATMTGAAVLDRRDFKIGQNYPDETSLNFAVSVDIALTAKRGE